MSARELLTKSLFLRVAKSDLDRLDRVKDRLTFASANAIAREAMRIGLAIIEKDPTKIISTSLPKRGRKKK